jgi:transcriptional regulator with XRE-family HTH domain
MEEIVSQRFKKIRDTLNLSQEDFGKRLNVSRSIVSHLERAGTMPNYEVLHNLLEKFEINLNWFICGSGKMKWTENETQVVSEPQAVYGEKNVYEMLIKEKDARISDKEKEIAKLDKQIADMDRLIRCLTEENNTLKLEPKKKEAG